jgi:hypothetical protein
MPGASCWDKMHKFYIQQGLFCAAVQGEPLVEGQNIPAFQCCAVSSKLYKKKREALGEKTTKRGRKRQRETEIVQYDDFDGDVEQI